MRILVESLKRLYENDRVTKVQLQKRVEKGIISIDEYNYIVGKDVLQLIRGTTPVLEFTLPFETDLLEEAYVTIAQRGTVVIEKNIDECTLKHDMLSVRLPQEETLKLIAQRNLRAEIQLRVLTRDGEALASNIETVDVGRILKDGVI